MEKKHRIEDFEKKKVVLLLAKIVKRVDLEKLKQVWDGIKEDKESLVKANLELKCLLGIDMNRAKFLKEQRLPTDILPELFKFLPAFENLKTLLSAVFFYQPKEMAEPKLKLLEEQIKLSLSAFIKNLEEAKSCVHELRP